MKNKDSIVSRLHQKRFSQEKRKANSPEVLDNTILLKNSHKLQVELYESKDNRRIAAFLAGGGCFGPEIQRRMIKENNLPVLNMFLAHWEFVPDARRYMIKKATESFIRLYVRGKSLGKQSHDFVTNGRFSTEFIRECLPYLNTRARAFAREFRHLQ